MNTFGTRIKELREIKNINQVALAEALNISKGIVSFWENDINEPKACYIRKLAVFFNVSTDYLLGLEDEYGNRTTSQTKKIETIAPAFTDKQKTLIQDIQGLERDQVEYVRGVVSELKRQNELLKKHRENRG